MYHIWNTLYALGMMSVDFLELIHVICIYDVNFLPVRHAHKSNNPENLW